MITPSMWMPFCKFALEDCEKGFFFSFYTVILQRASFLFLGEMKLACLAVWWVSQKLCFLGLRSCHSASRCFYRLSDYVAITFKMPQPVYGAACSLGTNQVVMVAGRKAASLGDVSKKNKRKSEERNPNSPPACYFHCFCKDTKHPVRKST